ncbi:MAG TPA: TlyA family RNA methyltransferase [Actinomycetota bacterium]|nr:TlyA family RNA methyltransferase [Actinomycetota bacterium]
MAKPARLDVELVRRKLVSSRAAAARAIAAGEVLVRGFPARGAATLVGPGDAIVLMAPPPRFVSRGGEKLAGALERLGVDPRGRRWLDAGASTGGFTDCLLQAGAEAVVAADVGYGQLALTLRDDLRVTVLERVNLRTLSPSSLPWAPDGIVADLSFISLTKVLPALALVAAEPAEFLCLVKPQFEAGRGHVGRGGVVRSADGWANAVERVAGSAGECGLVVTDGCVSSPRGPAGNVEFFLQLRTDGAGVDVSSLVGRLIADVEEDLRG